MPTANNVPGDVSDRLVDTDEIHAVHTISTICTELVECNVEQTFDEPLTVCWSGLASVHTVLCRGIPSNWLRNCAVSTTILNRLCRMILSLARRRREHDCMHCSAVADRCTRLPLRVCRRCARTHARSCTLRPVGTVRSRLGTENVAYRCRTCARNACMSLCADCFKLADHTDHDYNRFWSSSGGACDCGDTNVMKEDGCV